MKFHKTQVTILTRKDFGACYDFYKEKLQLIPTWGDRNGPWSSFATNEDKDYIFALFEGQAQSAYDGYVQPTTTTQPDTITLGIPCDNVDEGYKRLKEAGVEFLSEPQTIEAWGMRCVFLRDPEGNLLSLKSDIGG